MPGADKGYFKKRINHSVTKALFEIHKQAMPLI